MKSILLQCEIKKSHRIIKILMYSYKNFVWLPTFSSKSRSIYKNSRMKKLLLFLLVSTIGFSQSVYKGNISENGQPIPGARICVLHTARCTTSDFYGNYSIGVKVGDQLEISFVGLKTKIIKITNQTFLENDERVKPILSEDYSEKISKAIDSTTISKPSGYFESNLEYGLGEDIRYISRKENGFYKLKRRNQYERVSVQLNQELIVSTPMRLPSYQKSYAQGRSLNGELAYQSPETNEIFSWGPNVNLLQYSQNTSEYYPQGDIVNRTAVGANQLQLYNPNKFFQNTVDNKLSFNTEMISSKGNYLKADFVYKTGTISIPESRNNEIATSLKYFRKVSDKSTIETLLTYNNFDNNLSNSNFGINKMVFANAVTPIHFDNKWASALSNGRQRSYSSLENNPFYLIDTNLDQNKSKMLSFNFKHNYKSFYNENTIITSFQSSEITNTNGQSFYAASIIEPNFNRRFEKYSDVSLSDMFRHTFNHKSFIESKVDFRFQERDLNRNYFTGYNAPQDFPNISQNKTALNVLQNRFEVFANINGSYSFDEFIWYSTDLILKAKTDLNYSSTVENNFMSNYFVSAEFRQLFETRIHFTLSHGYNETEPSLQNNNLNFNSLRYQLNQFKELENTLELITPKNAVPTKEDITNLSLVYELNFWNFNLNYYLKQVKNLYTPNLNANAVNWSPDVNYKQKGVEFEIQKYDYYRRGFAHNFNLNFTYYRNEVTSLRNNQSSIPFAGFADISKNYMVGQPLGVIVGSGYLRDNNQNIIIDESGFPIKDPQSKILGNSNPDFVVGFSNTLSYKDFKLSLSFDWSQGGEIWNGTQQTLNYYGKSELTGNQRNITNYIFDGVTQTGAPNTKAVSFYDANLPVEQNRWVRYGVGGVAEDAIEDATYFRLNSINLSYSNSIDPSNKNIKFTIAFFVKNAFVATKSKTAFSTNSMFNSIDTTGLDYFNSPMMRSFGSSLTIKF